MLGGVVDGREVVDELERVGLEPRLARRHLLDVELRAILGDEPLEELEDLRDVVFELRQVLGSIFFVGSASLSCRR